MNTIRLHQIDLIQTDIDNLRKNNPADPFVDILNKINYQLTCMAWDLARLANPPIKVVPETQIYLDDPTRG